MIVTISKKELSSACHFCRSSSISNRLDSKILVMYTVEYCKGEMSCKYACAVVHQCNRANTELNHIPTMVEQEAILSELRAVLEVSVGEAAVIADLDLSADEDNRDFEGVMSVDHATRTCVRGVLQETNTFCVEAERGEPITVVKLASVLQTS